MEIKAGDKITIKCCEFEIKMGTIQGARQLTSPDGTNIIYNGVTEDGLTFEIEVQQDGN